MASRARIGTGDVPNLFGLDRSELRERLESYGVPGFHADQIYRWLYARRQLDPRAWTDLPSALRERLRRETRVDAGALEGQVEAPDATVKYRVRLSDGAHVECVWMVQSGRITLCVSSQVGCALSCDFCLTARMGLVRHLDAGEIAGQIALVARERELAGARFNVVFMGMGEPLHNYEAVTAALRILVDPAGFGLSRRRITVSTAGLAPAIERLAEEEVRPRLAVSLNATTDELRSRLMPINRRYPIARLLEACRSFARATGERCTFEYVLLDGVNDTDQDVRRLVSLVRSCPAKVNLIPFNPVPGWLAYRAPRRDRVVALRDALLAREVPVAVRWSRGAEARAACGQLALLPAEAPAAVANAGAR
jgi:23S rRNA (adenine2503-C2)-methyltransferase